MVPAARPPVTAQIPALGVKIHTTLVPLRVTCVVSRTPLVLMKVPTARPPVTVPALGVKIQTPLAPLRETCVVSRTPLVLMHIQVENVHHPQTVPTKCSSRVLRVHLQTSSAVSHSKSAPLLLQAASVLTLRRAATAHLHGPHPAAPLVTYAAVLRIAMVAA